MKSGSLIVVSAPSGAGKTTLVSRVRERYPEIVYSISCTTRPPRAQETHGKDYFFVSKAEFESMKSRNEFLEWKTVHQNLYGTPVMPVHQAIADGKCMILDIDVQGAGEVFRLFPSAVGVFITAPDMIELERRLRLRGSDSEDVIRVRLANAAKELSLASLFTHLIVNDDLDTAAESFVQIVRETCCAENEPGTPERA